MLPIVRKHPLWSHLLRPAPPTQQHRKLGPNAPHSAEAPPCSGGRGYGAGGGGRRHNASFELPASSHTCGVAAALRLHSPACAPCSLLHLSTNPSLEINQQQHILTLPLGTIVPQRNAIT